MCRLLIFVVVFVMSTSIAYSSDLRRNSARDEESRDGKFFSLFTIVRFRNDVCRADTGENGTCLTSRECSGDSAMSSGTCAQGFGVCCVFRLSCGDTTNRNATYFTNPGYSSPTSGALNCQLRVNKCSDNICQLRLDFETFEIMPPTTGTARVENTCDEDQFIASGGSSGSIGPICGYNTGQHVYLDSGRDSGPCTLTMVNSADDDFDRTWKIKISQIECCSELLAPSGCLQYYTGITGTIYSFNFDSSSTATGQHLANQNYGICIRREDGFCSIEYSENSNANSFKITTDGMMAGEGGGDPTVFPEAKSLDMNCQDDVVIIPHSTTPASLAAGPTNTYDRYCGTLLGFQGEMTTETVTSTIQPFVLYFVTNNVEGVADNDNEANDVHDPQPQKGFCLDYAQQPCTP